MINAIRRIKHDKSPLGSCYKIQDEIFLVFAISNKYVHLINKNNITIKITLWEWFEKYHKRETHIDLKWTKDKKQIVEECKQIRIPVIKKSVLFNQHIEVLRKYLKDPYKKGCPYESVPKSTITASKIIDVCRICYIFVDLDPPKDLNEMNGVCPCNLLSKEYTIAITIKKMREYDEHKRNLRTSRKEKNKDIRGFHKRTPA